MFFRISTVLRNTYEWISNSINYKEWCCRLFRYLQLRGCELRSHPWSWAAYVARVQAWFAAHQTVEHCIFVGLIDDVVVGYASLSPYRTKDAFKSTVELSIYIHQEYRGKGVASKLMAHILEYAKETETLHTVVSVITAGNAASTALHERFGFTYCGLTPQVGFKHGKYQDTETYALLV